MDGLDGEGEEGVGNVLDGMMRQLMTREILMEPLEELADKVGVHVRGKEDHRAGADYRSPTLLQYPAYLASQSTTPTIPATQLASYTQQSHIISQILTLFRSPQYSDEDEEKRKEVYGLMVRMQEMGSPPEEVMGEMPEGLVSRARRVCVGAGSWEPNSSALCLNLLLVGIRRGRRVHDHVIGARG